jgi:hypothetical protein
MKTTIIVSVALLFTLALNSCKDKIYHKYLANKPVYTSYEEFRSSVKFESSHELTTKGNIYIKDDYLFVSEPNEGIHFIDNSNPSNPINKGFLRINGNTGLVIKGNYLYANALIDLVVIDVSDLTNPLEVNRVKDVFPAALPQTLTSHPTSGIDKNLGVVTSFTVEEVKEEVPENAFQNCFACEIFYSNQSASFDNTSSSSPTQTSQGISGSIAKMTLVNDYLYVMESGVLIPFNISSPTQPTPNEGIRTWRDVETLFAYNSNIFMGTTTGMLIYNTSNPTIPQHISTVNHMTACDPVVVQDNYAYVTVRSGGTDCAGELNQLDVIDISNIESPQLMKSFQMKNPHGLGIDGTTLFICDGDAGLKVFDATDPLKSGDELVKKFGSIQATDIIPFNNIAIVIGDDGIYQYDYTDKENLTLLSKIKF